jgi:signal transduction histidine kinase/DNA-binding response OmpR family regulator
MSLRLLRVRLGYERDIVAARQRARHVCQLLGFDAQDQARVATAVSEIARNAFRYAGGGEVTFSLEGERSPQLLWIEVRDEGSGIADLDAVLEGRYRSTTGMGLGIVGARRLMDQCEIRSGERGTTVLLKKLLPESAPLVSAARLDEISRALAARRVLGPLDEIEQQNQELLRALAELRERQNELVALNRELEDTNRGVVALYAELEERADFLRRADETKSRFLSSMSHEFRTPLNSIRALVNLLVERSDGPLTAEQETQLRLIARSTQSLTELVDDLLDLAKIEAGKVEVRLDEFSVEEVFSMLRGMLRPLLVTERVALVFESTEGLPPMHSDEGKVSQILRNFISNALKFTERGEVRVSAGLAQDGEAITFSVADTGIGIAREDHERIFEEFTQVRSPLQRRVKGTGLGLPLCRRLATLLGGAVRLESAPDEGSTFHVTLPLRYAPPSADEAPLPEEQLRVEAGKLAVLVVEDEAETQLYYEKLLRGSAYSPIRARSLRQAKDAFSRTRPAAIVLDIALGKETAWRWLGELKDSADTATVPVIVASNISDPRKGYALGADLYLEKPLGRAALLEALNRLTHSKILIIDDDPAMRYALRKLCDATPFHVLEAADAGEGLRSASLMHPQLIVLDLNLPDRRGDEVLTQLSQDPLTRTIPVIIVTSERLTPAQREDLGRKAAAVLSKGELERESFGRLIASVQAGAPRGA